MNRHTILESDKYQSVCVKNEGRRSETSYDSRDEEVVSIDGKSCSEVSMEVGYPKYRAMCAAAKRTARVE
jgi:hypothetical protein